MATIIIDFTFEGEETYKKLIRDFKKFIKSGAMKYSNKDDKITITWCGGKLK